MMPAPSIPPRTCSPDDNTSPNPVLKFLETRRADGTELTASGFENGRAILFEAGRTGTERALQGSGFPENGAPSVCGQLQWSVQPVELAKGTAARHFQRYTRTR